VRRLREHHGAEWNVLQVPELREFDGVQLNHRARFRATPVAQRSRRIFRTISGAESRTAI
jgi:hypothetical protein